MIDTLIEQMIATAIEQRASDLYVLPVKAGLQIRLRCVTGVVTWQTVTRTVGEQLIAYFKFHANMTVSERRRPQVGALTWHKPYPVELRFSTVGDYAHQESLVIRLIYAYQQTQNAYLVPQQAGVLQQLAQQRGLMLFSGPTGAGKTTTMYTTAQKLAATAVVLAIEDPVEIKEPQFIQLQVNEAAGMAYDTLIKVGLRHRPDAFIIGEIRDAVTAQAAVCAALSGHLVLSTVHAKSAAGTVNRLLDLGVDATQLQQVLTAACYQRLIPRIQQGPAVLLDILTESDLWQETTTVSERWRHALETAAQSGHITAKTAASFQAG
ncbi:competence type IV pilus ATPase ComGA [Levilactobacillus brevis]|uniref:competence type IV pilus ATPase ComGA n=1 Tax=Levilactobacillus brevis TaxID=1580 RepID=UPI00226E5641|nr:competence type IV pilus ATPase ComGA [Levilactobacillus brevis]